MGGGEHEPARRLGIATVGIGGAVATTAVAGVELLRMGLIGSDGLPLAGATGSSGIGAALTPYTELLFAGWDVCQDDLGTALRNHGVLDESQIQQVAPCLSALRPWPAIHDGRFSPNVGGQNRRPRRRLREQVEAVREDLRSFEQRDDVSSTVMINLASSERSIDTRLPILSSLAEFNRALDADDVLISPAMVYAYASLSEGIPYANFTPSVAVEMPALIELANKNSVPIAGKDGKTGQTMLKTALASTFRSRALRVDGWFSTNLLGNRDGLALTDPAVLDSKRATKKSALDKILGYHVKDHVIAIHYIECRGDNKEAWDSVDLVGFLGARMQVKINFLCRDSILAAPLVIEIARLLELAKRLGCSGAQEQLGFFFKEPMTRDGRSQEHALHLQAECLWDWLGNAQIE